MRPGSHARTDHSGRHVDIDDSRIGQRRIRNLSPKQEKLLTPQIDRGEVHIQYQISYGLTLGIFYGL